MNTEQAYNLWSVQYDTNENKTRDLEAVALREVLADVSFSNCLEIGCGTGKNTEWLQTKASQITAVDLSAAMLAKAKEKINNDGVTFVQADITQAWAFANKQYDLVTFSLVLEHIQDLDSIFKNVAAVLSSNGHLYVGELHPFKQYSGTKARFETETGTQVVDCYDHNISEFVGCAKKHGLKLIELDEYFDDDNSKNIPRILTLLFKKS